MIGRNLGASALPTGCSQAEPEEVSALRASPPRAAFTPGPWGVEQIGANIYIGQLRQGEGRSGFEDILYATDCTDYTPRAVARELANARLIAAAPELYEALEDARAAVDSLDEDELGRHPELGHPYRDELLAKIAAALAKARGESA